jgi:uncharacterized membrane protein YwzB
VERLVPGLPWQVLAVTTLSVWAVAFTDMMAGTTTGLMPLDAYLSKAHGSIFPLFPWFAFAGFGFLAGQQGALRGWLGLVGVFGAFALPWLNLPSTPAFFLERLGWVLMVVVVVWGTTNGLQSRSLPLPKWLLLAGRQSLVIYVAHLLMIHAVPWWSGRTLDKLIGPSQPPTIVFLIFLALLIASWLAAWAWEKRSPLTRTAQA